jgi:hypothetical protein
MVALGALAVDALERPSPGPACARAARRGARAARRAVAQHDRGGAPQDDARRLGAALADDVLGRPQERALVDHLGRRPGAREGLRRRGEAHEHALEGSAHGVVVSQRIIERDGEALRDGRGDDAVDERHAEAVGEAGADLAAAGAVGGPRG